MCCGNIEDMRDMEEEKFEDVTRINDVSPQPQSPVSLVLLTEPEQTPTPAPIA